MKQATPNTPRLHIVSFQTPYPPSYGGVIDVYYKIKALKEAGYHITLHTYRYRLPEAPQLAEITDQVIYYPRYTGFASQLSLQPYIVFSRRNRHLLENLCQDTAPILFEGLHTCYFLNHPCLQNRIKIVRAHNVEHHYYKKLGKAAFPMPTSIYFFLEALKLKRYEPILQHAHAILAITPEEQAYFRQTYPAVPSYTIPCFFDDQAIRNHPETQQATSRTAPFILYHGNLSVAENIHAATYILKQIVPLLPAGKFKIILAGKDPVEKLKKLAARYPQVEIIANPNDTEMDTLIRDARINLLPTFQNTGFKLKLIHALTKGRGHCAVNTPMLSDPALKAVCHVADSPEQFAGLINRLSDQLPTPEELRQRTDFLQSTYSNSRNALKIKEIIESYQ